MRIGLGLGIGFGSVVTTPFDPSSIAGLTAWYRSDHVTTVSSSVSVWPDKSGNGYDAAVGFGSLPTYNASGGANGQPRVIGDGSDQLITTTFATPSQPFEIFAVVKPTLAIPAGRSYLWDFGGGAIQACWQEASTGLYTLYDGASLSGPAATNTATIVDAIFHGASSSVATNGGSATTGDAGSGAAGSAHFALMNYFGSGQGLVGDAYEYLMYASPIGSTDKTKLIAYLKARYGIA